ncbi:MAG: FeoB-associated Cys-rich membrane protein [Raoultibacter sp.]
MGTLIVGSILLVIVVAIVAYMVRLRRAGKHIGCAGCSAKNGCAGCSAVDKMIADAEDSVKEK